MFRNFSKTTITEGEKKLPFPKSPITLLDAGILLLSFFVSIIVSFVLYFIKGLFKIDSVSDLIGIPPDVINILGQYLVAGTILCVLFYYIFRKHKFNLISFGFRSMPFAKTLAYISLAFLATFIAWAIIAPIVLILFPQINLAESQEIFTSNMSITAQVLLIFYAIILGPFLEEVVFRGVVLPAISNKWGFLIGVFLSTVIWALLHFQINVIIFTSIFGIILSYIYAKSQSLWPSYLTHVLKNLLAVIAIYTLGLF